MNFTNNLKSPRASIPGMTMSSQLGDVVSLQQALLEKMNLFQICKEILVDSSSKINNILVIKKLWLSTKLEHRKHRASCSKQTKN